MQSSQGDQKTALASNITSSQRVMNSEEALHEVGGFGCFQLLAAPVLIGCYALNGLLIYPLSYLHDQDTVKVDCHFSNNTISACSQDTACNSSEVDFYSINWDESKRNFITDFNEYCSPQYLLDLQGTIYFVGIILGSLVSMRLADVIGRKPIILIGLCIYGVCAIMLFLIKEEWALFLAIALCGFQMPNTCQCGYLLMIEYLDPNHRSKFSSFANVIDGGSNIWLPFYFRYTDSWIYLLILISAMVVVLFFLVLIITPESPRFLVTQHKYSRARTSLKWISRINRKGNPENIVFPSQHLRKQIGESLNGEDKVEYTFKMLCKRSNPFFVPMLIMPVLWFSSVMQYFGINFSYDRLDGDPYVNGTVAGCTQIVAYIIIGFIADCIGRKPSIIIFFGVGGVGSIVYCFVYGFNIPSYVMLSLARFGAASVFQFVYVLNAQIFPTAYRTTLFGVSNTFGRVGGMVSPLIPNISDRWFMMILGGFSVISFFLSFALPQTKGQQLDDTIDEARKVTVIE